MARLVGIGKCSLKRTQTCVVTKPTRTHIEGFEVFSKDKVSKCFDLEILYEKFNFSANHLLNADEAGVVEGGTHYSSQRQTTVKSSSRR